MIQCVVDVTSDQLSQVSIDQLLSAIMNSDNIELLDSCMASHFLMVGQQNYLFIYYNYTLILMHTYEILVIECIHTVSNGRVTALPCQPPAMAMLV